MKEEEKVEIEMKDQALVKEEEKVEIEMKDQALVTKNSLPVMEGRKPSPR